MNTRPPSTERKQEEAETLTVVTSCVVMAVVSEDKNETEENGQSHWLSLGHDCLAEHDHAAKSSSYRQRTSRHFKMKNLKLFMCPRTFLLFRNGPFFHLDNDRQLSKDPCWATQPEHPLPLQTRTPLSREGSETRALGAVLGSKSPNPGDSEAYVRMA